MPRFATLLLDLDGTIVDAFTTIHRSYAQILPELGLPAPTMEQVRAAVGGGLENAMRRFVPESMVVEAARRHVEYTDTILLDDVTLMPGTLELLRTQQAEGVRMAVFTNKRGEHARRVCEHLGITPFLRGVFGAGDTAWLKPQPEFANHVLAALGTAASETMLIGDSPFDVKAAHNGGFACWCVTTGTHGAEELRTAGADAVFSDLFALQAACEAS